MSATIKQNTDAFPPKGEVVLPFVDKVDTEKHHISIYIIDEGLKQAKANLAKSDEAIKKATEQLNQLQAHKIASTAQLNMLTELRAKIIELDVPVAS